LLKEGFKGDLVGLHNTDWRSRFNQKLTDKSGSSLR